MFLKFLDIRKNRIYITKVQNK